MTAGLFRHRLVVEADAHPNLMLRLLEPFAVNDVQPTRIRLDGPADGRADILNPGDMRAEIAFLATHELAERLWARIDVMVPVRTSHLVSSALTEEAAA
ncbi:conserved hypothetical protein [Ancylobacter novellus DSM 506]|jgi:hypothetical protein|uniref:Uncharacterized protein n=1 Tax=Ancylobacter novellus (strain ATCC 8093 / DSM 506 / JCM 20403 / CCM 1077 / IAM 12100 / NBRC 12443 / NCIMB 10456) TaxID=639283 RepID=D7A8Q2_ANCN5|nr:hypothetical protein [Ancylobacter novellus]ADH90586.1 conserved hypothetical protein [Ancylobacter novellus DSM 506]MDF2620084.1 hypothetical protein [Xanthobacteraceae bacterium]